MGLVCLVNRHLPSSYVVKLDNICQALPHTHSLSPSTIPSANTPILNTSIQKRETSDRIDTRHQEAARLEAVIPERDTSERLAHGRHLGDPRQHIRGTRPHLILLRTISRNIRPYDPSRSPIAAPASIVRAACRPVAIDSCFTNRAATPGRG